MLPRYLLFRDVVVLADLCKVCILVSSHFHPWSVTFCSFCIAEFADYINKAEVNTAVEYLKRAYTHRSRLAGSKREAGKLACIKMDVDDCAKAVSGNCCKGHSCIKAFSPQEVSAVRT